MSEQITNGIATKSETHPVSTVSPTVDVYENGEELLLIADVPGATPEGIDVRLDQGLLTIQAKREAETTTARNVAAGHRARDYFRVFSVPSEIDATKIDAQLSNGVLQIRLPKADSIKPRRIEVTQG